MALLLQISDTHFGTEQPPVVAALEHLIEHACPDLLVISGDITQRARRSQFARARAFVDRLSVRNVVAIPGNHDIPMFNVLLRAFAPYSNYRRAFGDELEPEWRSDDMCVLCVNTTRAYRRKDGEVSEEQIARVSADLRNADSRQLRVVIIHQPVHVIRDKDETNLLHGYEGAVREWSSAGADLIMGGHIHLPYVRELGERLQDLPRRVWAVQAGTAVSSRIRRKAPNSVNLVRYQAGQSSCAVEQWDFQPTRHAFDCVHTETLPLDRR